MLIVHEGRDWSSGLFPKVFKLCVLGFFTVVTAYVAIRYALTISQGGQYWTTGDWLINYDAGFVRRGLTGTLTLALGHLTGLDIVDIAGAMQIVVYIAMVSVVLYNFTTVPWSAPVLMLLFSPVFLLMPFYYLKLSMLKEMIGFLALALMAVTASTHRPGFLWAGIVVLGLAGLAHEINTFLAPAALVFVLLYLRAGIVDRRMALVAMTAIVVMAGLILLFSIIFSGHGLSSGVCDELRLHGEAKRFCQPEGPIMWLERDTAYGIRFTWHENVTTGVWPWFILGYFLSIAPFFLFRLARDRRGILTASCLAAVCLGILLMAPLFIVASDWGRWIAMYVFALALLSLAALRLGEIEPRVLSIGPLFLVYGFGWSMADYGEPLSAGILTKVFDASSRILEVSHWLFS